MIEKLAKISDRYEEIMALLNRPETMEDSNRFQELSKEQARMFPIVEVFNKLTDKQKELEENEQMANDPNEDPEVRSLAKEEID